MTAREAVAFPVPVNESTTTLTVTDGVTTVVLQKPAEAPAVGYTLSRLIHGDESVRQRTPGQAGWYAAHNNQRRVRYSAIQMRTSNRNEITEFCDDCGEDTPHAVYVEIVEEGAAEKHLEYSREPYRTATCRRCGYGTTQRMNSS